jgi:carbon-monoxide dehydrogenase medium subunit
MIPAPFDFARPASLEEALALLSEHGEDAKLLAGGHSLVPALKLRLLQPKLLVDLSRLEELKGIRPEAGGFRIGALTTHAEIEASPILRRDCPLLPETARTIGDLQVRNRGTFGGAVAYADPAGDWPAAVLALQADMEIAGPEGRRLVPAAEFFVDLLQTAVSPVEILTAIRVPRTDGRVAYEKSAQQACGFAICGAAVVADSGKARVGITGAGPKAYRALGVEEDLAQGKTPEEASRRAAEGLDALSDLHASAEYRSHLARVLTRRALERALGA